LKRGKPDRRCPIPSSNATNPASSCASSHRMGQDFRRSPSRARKSTFGTLMGARFRSSSRQLRGPGITAGGPNTVGYWSMLDAAHADHVGFIKERLQFTRLWFAIPAYSGPPSIVPDACLWNHSPRPLFDVTLTAYGFVATNVRPTSLPNVHSRENAIHPSRHPPVPVPQKLHRCGHQQRADDRRIDGHGKGNAQAERLHNDHISSDE
jgi:hypothetical protein